jgi:YidC/Oxa1 family membrane protein insertase
MRGVLRRRGGSSSFALSNSNGAMIGSVSDPEEAHGQNSRGMSTTSRTSCESSSSNNNSASSDSTVFTNGDSVPPVSDGGSTFTVPWFGSSPIQPEAPAVEASATTVASLASDAVVTTGGLDWDPTWYNPADKCIDVIHSIHDMTGYTYAGSIVLGTFVVRVGLFPLFVMSQRNTSRMAHMRPEMEALKSKVDRMGQKPNQETQMKMAMQMKALFAKYECNPAKGLLLPFIQAPIFMSMFFGLKKMPDYFPDDLSTGGVLWFPDLSIPDATLALPVLSALTFLGMVEIGKKEMMATNPAQGIMFVNGMRGLSVLMVAFTYTFPASVFCYWMCNNTVSLVQAAAFKVPFIRSSLGIWEPPKPVPGAPPPAGFMEQIQSAMGTKKKDTDDPLERIKAHNETIETQKRAAAVSSAGRTRTNKRGRAKRR